MPDLTPAAAPIAALGLLILAVVSTYTVAAAIRRRERRRARHDVNELRRAFDDYLGGHCGSEALREAVRHAEESAYWAALETFDLRRRPERRTLSQALAGNRHERRERRALADDSPWRRELAARRLALLSSPRARRALRRALARGPELVTLAAAAALARDRDAAALHWVLHHPQALASRSPAARAALLRRFGPRALPVLAATLERGPGDPRLERAILDALGHARRRLALGAIERRLVHDDLEVRVAAARALGRLEAAACAPALAASLRDPAWQVRAQAAWALGRARAASAIPGLTARLSDRSWWVRRHSAYALAALGDEGRRTLERVIEASPDPYARDIALEALETRAAG